MSPGQGVEKHAGHFGVGLGGEELERRDAGRLGRRGMHGHFPKGSCNSFFKLRLKNELRLKF